jgi:hypothetical protein
LEFEEEEEEEEEEGALLQNKIKEEVYHGFCLSKKY